MYQPFRDFEARRPRRVRAQPAPRPPQVRGDGRARRRHAARLLQRRPRRDRRPRALGRAAAPARRARPPSTASGWPTRRSPGARHVSDYRDAWRIVELADHPSLGTCLDTFHILSRGSDPAGIGEIPGEKIFFLQLADAPVLAMDVLQWSRHYRCFPGQGGFDLAGFWATSAAGYAGRCRWRSSTTSSARPTRTGSPWTPCVRSWCSRSRSASGRLPPAPELRGLAFVELRWDRSPAPRPATCSAHGLRPRRAAPLQAGAALAAGRGPGPAQPRRRRADGDPLVVALGVESADPAASAAARRGAAGPVLPRRRGPGEADLAAVAAPDGTSVFFCRTDAGADGWLGDFVELEPATTGDAGLRADRPRRPLPALRLLRRGDALLPLGARPASRTTARTSPARTACCAAGRSATRAGGCGSR